MARAERQRLEAIQHSLLRMSPEEAEQWVDENVKSVPELKSVVGDLVKIVNALAREVRRKK